ncbi:5'-nucleotidase C-terminal domain-containing protein [Defluviitalea phaphyphila]|uniref:5'-nucleotidase C-terminal domain-containing protein n=1 Tax=Defluviitalea phaphyphila TaxID=1473580 RepID=UPI0007318531|nr:5'-nucleotidase C-terminal domain-containing protein [Defluviitalea phaphyphila]
MKRKKKYNCLLSIALGLTILLANIMVTVPVNAASFNVVKITILGTSDIHGRIYTYDYATDSEDSDAGLAKVQTIIKKQKEENSNVILMGMGDTVQDNSEELFNDLPIHLMIQVLNTINDDIWVLGNHEFNFGKDFLDKTIEAFNVKSINVNELIEEGKLSGYDTLTIFHTNDIHGFMEEGAYDGMGYAKIATKVNQTKAKQENVLLLDAGDAIQGSNLVTLNEGEAAIEVMNEMNYDVMVAGNHEFDYGKERLKELEEMANFPILGANIKYEDGTDFLTPYVIKEVGGIKVGIFGLTTPETTYKSHPDNTKGLKFNDIVETAKEMVEELEEQTDVIIALAHLGIEGEDTSIKLAQNVEGIDVIIDGHSHSVVENRVENGTLIVQAGEKSNNLGVVQLAFKDGELVSKYGYLFSKEEASYLQEDETIKTLIDKIKLENEKIENEVVANSPIDLDGERENVRTKETNLGNLITAAMLDVSGADVALMNGGGIRASIPAGEVTKGEVLTVLPFGNTVRVLEVTGADIKAMMEQGLSTYPEPLGAFPHIAGMTVTFDPSKEAGNRVVEIKVVGKPLDENKTYTLVTNDFLAAGGDGYDMLVNKKVVAEYNTLDQELINYIQKNGFNAAKVDGRIKAIDPISEVDIELPNAA